MPDDLNKKIEDIIKQGLETFKVEGAAVAVVKDGETVLLDGFGWADKDKKTAMTADHVLPIASTSKAFTATGVALLADEGKLDLDTPVREYMPDFGLSDPVASNAVTARDLLCHRTGLPRHDLLWITWEDIPRDELIFKRVRHLPASKSFRSEWQYQNHMYAAAGCLTERLSGMSWEDFVRARIFKPLGMTASSFGQDERDPAQAYAVLYNKNKADESEECQPESVACVGPAGSIRSTARDMEKWLRFNLSGGKAGDVTVLGEKTFHELHKPNIPYQLFPFEVDETQRVGYGLGWFIDCYRGDKLVQHGGNVTGASILVSMLPAKNTGVVILTNENSTLLAYALTLGIFDLLYGREDNKDWLAFFKEKQDELKKAGEEGFDKFLSSKIDGKPMLHDEDEYCGKYDNPAYGEISVFMDDAETDPEKKLRVDIHGSKFALAHMHYDIFYVTIYDIPLPASFKTGVDGKLESLSIQFEPSMEAFLTFTRVPDPAEEEQKP
jgi:CubicO group peptidase (beta-lactamase class C family)